MPDIIALALNLPLATLLTLERLRENTDRITLGAKEFAPVYQQNSIFFEFLGSGREFAFVFFCSKNREICP